MGRRSQNTKARIANGLKGAQARKATVEEVPDDGDHISGFPSHAAPETTSQNTNSCPDSCGCHLHPDSINDNSWDFDLGNELPDLDCDNLLAVPADPDLGEEIIAAPEILDEAELDAFSQFLFDAQAAAQKAEQEREKTRKWPKKYTGNSVRSKR